MKTVQRFQTRDGREFADETEAKRHEDLLDACESIMAPLGNPPKLHAGRSKRHDLGTFRSVRAEMVRLASRKMGHLEWDKYAFKDGIQHGIIGRYLDDSGSVLNRFWTRLMCFDNRGYEFEQPYYAAESIKKASQGK